MFRTDAPTFEEILAVRAERQELVTEFLVTVTPALLAEERDDRTDAMTDENRRIDLATSVEQRHVKSI